MQLQISEDKKEEFLGKGMSLAGYNLQLLGTNPKYQRNGAGTALIQYGLEKVLIDSIRPHSRCSLLN